MTIGGLKKTSSPLALVAAAGFLMGGMALTPAMAADLGGDCCADLEERVAELEATTARKGNRKVSLTISGHVARSIGWYEDDGARHNGTMNTASGAQGSEWYSAGHGVSGSRIQFSGSAQLTSSWTAGYTLRLRLSGDRTSDVLKAQTNTGGAGRSGSGSVSHDRNFVYLKNARLGTFLIGEASAPTDGVANISLGGHGVVGDSAGTDWNGSIIQGTDLEQGTRQAIAWISPTVRGFTFAAAWADMNHSAAPNGDDDAASDYWDFALRYAQEFGPIRLAAGIGYTTVDNDEDVEGSNVMGSVAVMHTPTGLNISVAAGTEHDGGVGTAANTVNAPDTEFWHISAGINRDFTGYGNTSIFGEYGEYDYDVAGVDAVNMWGIGIVQHFDKAATELYIAYREWDADEDVTTHDGDVRQLMAGMRIKF